MAEALLKYETLTSDDVERIMSGEVLDKPTVSDLLQQEAAKPAAKPEPQTPPEELGEEPAGGAIPSPA